MTVLTRDGTSCEEGTNAIRVHLPGVRLLIRTPFLIIVCCHYMNIQEVVALGGFDEARQGLLTMCNLREWKLPEEELIRNSLAKNLINCLQYRQLALLTNRLLRYQNLAKEHLGLSGGPILARAVGLVGFGLCGLPARMESDGDLPPVAGLSLTRRNGVYNYHTSTQFLKEKYRISRATIEIAPVPLEQEHAAFPRFGPRKSRATRKQRRRDANANRQMCSCEVQKEARECFQSWCG